jgi:hypothetical protein
VHGISNATGNYLHRAEKAKAGEELLSFRGGAETFHELQVALPWRFLELVDVIFIDRWV